MNSIFKSLRPLSLLWVAILWLSDHALAKELLIPVQQGCEGKVRHSKMFSPAVRRVDSVEYLKTHGADAEVPEFFVGTWRSGGQTFQVYYGLGASCDPSFVFENAKREVFTFSGEDLDLSRLSPVLRQSFNVCTEIIRSLSRVGGRIEEKARATFPVNRKGVLVRQAGLYREPVEPSPMQQLPAGTLILVMAYRPPSKGEFRHSVRVQLKGGKEGWIFLNPQGEHQQTEIDIMRCRGD